MEQCATLLTDCVNPCHCFSFGNFVASADDVFEGVLKGGSSNEEAIDVRFANELISIFICDTATIENASLLGCISRNIRSKPGSQVIVCLLRLFRRGSHTGSNGPDRLVSNHNFAPVFDLLTDGHKLSGIDGVGLTSFTLVKLFTDASHDVEVLV